MHIAVVVIVVDATNDRHKCSTIDEISGRGETLDACVDILHKHKDDVGAGVRCWCSDIGHHIEAQFCWDKTTEPVVLAAAKVDVEVTGCDEWDVVTAQSTESMEHETFKTSVADRPR